MSESSINPINMEIYSQLEELMGDEGFREIIDFFMSDTQQAMKDIPEFINHQQPEHVGAICHKLKSSCRLIGAFTMGELCNLLEEYAENHDDSLAGQVFLKLEAEFNRVVEKMEIETAVEL